MIEVTRLNGSKLWVSPDQIEFLEATPDTHISMVTGRIVIVKETPQELRELIIAFRRRCQAPPEIRPPG